MPVRMQNKLMFEWKKSIDIISIYHYFNIINGDNPFIAHGIQFQLIFFNELAPVMTAAVHQYFYMVRIDIVNILRCNAG
jgi:hypothetical protein